MHLTFEPKEGTVEQVVQLGDYCFSGLLKRGYQLASIFSVNDGGNDKVWVQLRRDEKSEIESVEEDYEKRCEGLSKEISILNDEVRGHKAMVQLLQERLNNVEREAEETD